MVVVVATSRFAVFCEHVMKLANLEEKRTGSPPLHTCRHTHTHASGQRKIGNVHV